MADALIIIDIQNDYFPGGKMALVGSDAAGAQAARVLEHFRRLGKPVFHIQHLSVRPGASFFIPATTGAEIHSSVTPLDGEVIIQKNFPNAFRHTDLASRLQAANVKRITVVGMMTQMCIDTSVRAAADLGFEVTLIHDACATRDQTFGNHTVPAAQVQAAFMAALSSFSAVQSTEQTLES